MGQVNKRWYAKASMHRVSLSKLVWSTVALPLLELLPELFAGLWFAPWGPKTAWDAIGVDSLHNVPLPHELKPFRAGQKEKTPPIDTN